MPTILVVNDSQVPLIVAVALIESRGYQTITARNGREAVDACIRHEPDLMVTDIQMPVLDGISCAREVQALTLRGKLPVIPVIGTSAMMNDDTRARCAAAGMAAVLVKPIDPDDLAAAIADALARPDQKMVQP